ncbi:MAG: NAD(P)/FAD-dependent oxidoreductase [Rubrobacter sp.]
MTRQASTVIVGGGIWGMSTAYHLARGGSRDVLVLERNECLFDETTSQAAGLVGQIRAAPLMRRAIRYAIDLFTDFEHETGHDPGFRQVGSLLLALTPERMASFEEHVEHANRNGVEARFVDGAEMSRLAPHLEVSRVEGGYFVPEDGYLDSGQCARAFCNAAEDLGVRIRTGTAATGLSVLEGRVVGVETDRGLVEAEQVVVTAGPWTGIVARKMAGHHPAMVPIRHQRVTTAPAPGIPDDHPVVRVTDASCYLRPERGGYLYGFFEPDPTSYDLEKLPAGFGTADIEEPVEVMEEARERLSPVFPVLKNLEIADYKRGLTTFAPDGAYLVGPVPQVGGLFAATGCAALGIAGSAAVGRWLADWVALGDPGEDLSSIDPERFGERAADRGWVRREGEGFYGGYYSVASMSVSGSR